MTARVKYEYRGSTCKKHGNRCAERRARHERGPWQCVFCANEQTAEALLAELKPPTCPADCEGCAKLREVQAEEKSAPPVAALSERPQAPPTDAAASPEAASQAQPMTTTGGADLTMSQRPVRRAPPVADHVREERKPPPPETLVGALQDRVHETSGRLISSFPIVAPKREGASVVHNQERTAESRVEGLRQSVKDAEAPRVMAAPKRSERAHAWDERGRCTKCGVWQSWYLGSSQPPPCTARPGDTR